MTKKKSKGNKCRACYCIIYSKEKYCFNCIGNGKNGDKK